ncbi:hypothetical protein K8B33_13890 [Alcanivorax sp. JB21]|nr:hypothetical protein [Alcanivorax limicola]
MAHRMVRPAVRKHCVLAATLALLPLPTTADIWTEPAPLRRDALLEGRQFNYNSESFLHRLSFRQLSERPWSDADGLSGTAGSSRSDELYLDMFLQKTLRADDGRNEAFARMQRSEDFDGRFDRQIIGFGHRVGDYRLAIAGDVQADKAETDVQFEAQWQPDNYRLARLALILPDAYFNDKTPRDAEYRTKPLSYFAHARIGGSLNGHPGWGFQGALTYSPPARIIDHEMGIDASGNRTRAMVEITLPAQGALRPQVRLEGERSTRSFNFTRSDEPADDFFRRRMHSVRLMATHTTAHLTPSFGIYHLRLHESGWFGDNLAVSGRESRDELIGFIGIRQQLGDRWHWEPALYAGHSSVIQVQVADTLSGDEQNKDENEWQGKLALPFRYTLDEANGAVLTINPTLRLHRAAFGGGNIQLHWPF